MKTYHKKIIYGNTIRMLKSFNLPRKEYLAEKQAIHEYLFGASTCKWERPNKMCGITQNRCSHVVKPQLCSHYEREVEHVRDK